MTRKLSGALAATALLLGTLTVAGSAQAGALSPAAHPHADNGNGIVQVRHGWRGGGVGIYIGPSYGGYYDGYYGDDYYRPRYRYYDDGYYDRPYRTHSRRWTQERFKHPLGRR